MKKTKMENKIYRSLGLILRNEDENSRVISGRAIVFDSFSKDLGGFIERIEPGAISEELLLNSDVIMNVNHDNDRMLARYTKGEGTLSLELREDGLYFEFEAPDTQLGNDVLFHVRAGNYTECSFACLISKDHVRRYKEDGQYVQVIEGIDALLDTSIVTRGAYGDTNVAARSEEELKKEFEEIKEEVDKAEAEVEEAKRAAEEQEHKDMIIKQLDNKLEEFYKNIQI